METSKADARRFSKWTEAVDVALPPSWTPTIRKVSVVTVEPPGKGTVWPAPALHLDNPDSKKLAPLQIGCDERLQVGLRGGNEGDVVSEAG